MSTGDAARDRLLSAPFAVGLGIEADDAVRICPRGELDLSAAPELQQHLDRFLTEGRTVVLDLSELSFIDSTGLKIVLQAWGDSTSNGCVLRLRPGNERIMHTFEIAGLLDLVKFERP